MACEEGKNLRRMEERFDPGYAISILKMN